MAGAFFGGDGVIGEPFCEARDNGGFGALVGLSDQVYFIAFVADFGGAREFFAQDLSGFAGYGGGRIKQIFRHRDFLMIAGKRRLSNCRQRGSVFQRRMAVKASRKSGCKNL
jgi:hypothetical protein